MRILTWKDNSNEILKRYQKIVNYIPDLSNYVVYEIEWEDGKEPECRSQIVFFINPMTQRSKIFEKYPTEMTEMKPIGYGGVTEFEIETILNYPIVVKIPGEHFTKQCLTSDGHNINKSKKRLYYTKGIFVNYKNKKFYLTNEGYLDDVYVFTLDTLCPHISKKYIIRPKLEQLAKYKLYTNRAYKYIQYTEDDENQNATSDQEEQFLKK